MNIPAVISISGVSGVGKTVLLEWLLGIINLSGLIPSYTTRDPRPTDIGEYNYITPEQFKQLKDDHEFAWFIDEYGNQYGTRSDDLYRAVADARRIKKVSMLLIVPKTISNLRQYIWNYGGEVLSFYVSCNDENELRRRLLARDNDPVLLEKRIEGSKNFYEQASHIADLRWIDNARDDNLAYAKEQVVRILKMEGFTRLP